MNIKSVTQTLPIIVREKVHASRDLITAKVYSLFILGIYPKVKDRPKCSFLIPSRYRADILGDCLDGLINIAHTGDEIVVAMHKPTAEYKELAIKYSRNVRFITVNYECCLAHIWNKLIIASNNSSIFILNDKARPNKKYIDKSILLHQAGVGLCGLYRFGFFHLNKYLVYKIGWFDERFVDSGYEDTDFLRRVAEANIAYYESDEIEYIKLPSLFKQTLSGAFFKEKWGGAYNTVRLISDESLYPRIRDSYEKYTEKYLEFNRSHVMGASTPWFNNIQAQGN